MQWLMLGDGKSLLCHKVLAAEVERAAEGAEAGAAAAYIGAEIHEGGEDGDGLSDGASAVTDEHGEAGSDMGIFEDEAFCARPEEESDAHSGEADDAGIDVERGGGAGSSGDIGGAPPILPPPMPPPAEPRVGRRRQGALAVLCVPGGKIILYAGGARDFMTAECGNRRHGRCIKTKTCEAPPARLARTREGQGRPVGWLVAWLKKGLLDTPREKHWDPMEEPTLVERRAARDEVLRLQAGGSADAALLLAGECDHPEGDGFESAVVP